VFSKAIWGLFAESGRFGGVFGLEKVAFLVVLGEVQGTAGLESVKPRARTWGEAECIPVFTKKLHGS